MGFTDLTTFRSDKASDSSEDRFQFSGSLFAQSGLEEGQFQSSDCALGVIAWAHISTALESALTLLHVMQPPQTHG